MSIPDNIGRNIRRLRKEKGITQEELALDLNMSIPNLRRIEHGEGNPTLKTLEKIAGRLEVSFQNIMEENAEGTEDAGTADLNGQM